jgi:hypothetical protein
LSFFDRLARGPGSLQQGDFDNWNEMVGAAPAEKFGRATYDSIRQVDPQDYYDHTQPGVGGTDPFGGLVPQQRSGLAQSILGELFRRGLGQQEISQGAGLGTLDPERMSPQDLASLTQWMQRSQPKAFGRVAAQYQDKPDILSSLLGNQALMSTLASLGMKLAADQFSKRR